MKTWSLFRANPEEIASQSEPGDRVRRHECGVFGHGSWQRLGDRLARRGLVLVRLLHREHVVLPQSLAGQEGLVRELALGDPAVLADLLLDHGVVQAQSVAASAAQEVVSRQRAEAENVRRARQPGKRRNADARRLGTYQTRMLQACHNWRSYSRILEDLTGGDAATAADRAACSRGLRTLQRRGLVKIGRHGRYAHAVELTPAGLRILREIRTPREPVIPAATE